MFVKLETQIEHFSSLVSELLDVSKMQAGTLDYMEEVLDLDRFVQENVEMVQQMHHEHKLNIHGLPTHATIRGDRSKLSQVLINLLNNAMKYSPHADTVDISLEITQGSILVHVRDYGIGISQEHLDHIFERFYRVHNTAIRQYSGIGLGLYVAKAIVDRHGGRIWFTNNQNIGTTFSFTLPARPRTGPLAKA